MMTVCSTASGVPGGVAGGTHEALIELRSICKSFGPVRANRNISLSIRPGRVLALLGENGAGKSTLMSMLSGMNRPDSGEILVQGEVRSFQHPKDALNAGIGMVYQQFMLVNDMTVAENIFLGQPGARILSPAAMNERVRALSQRYRLGTDPLAKVGDLSMGERQRVEILKLLYRRATVLILDEPTAVLTPSEVDELFVAVRSMAEQGAAIVFISHKLQEVLDIADDIAILRDGEVVGTFLRDDVPDQTTLASRMVGRELREAAPVASRATGETILDVRGLSGNGLHDISFSLRQGEILAVAGVAGNGQKVLAETVTGLLALQQGEIDLFGMPFAEYREQSAYGAYPEGKALAYIPEDRRGLAVCPDMPLLPNFLLTTRHLFSGALGLRRKRAAAELERIIKEYDVRPGRAEALAKTLSGGNLQKLVIGRENYARPGLIVAENPTQGLDVAAAADVIDRLLEARAHAGILLITNDLAEAIRVGDRVAVMFRGMFMAVVPRDEAADMGKMGLLMSGVAPQSAM